MKYYIIAATGGGSSCALDEGRGRGFVILLHYFLPDTKKIMKNVVLFWLIFLWHSITLKW